MECEISPDFDLPAYKGLEVEVEPLKISPEDVDNRLDALKADARRSRGERERRTHRREISS